MTLDRAALIQARVDEIISWLNYREMTCKEGFFGREDLMKELNDLKMYLERIKVREIKRQLEDYAMNIEFETYITPQLTFAMVECGQLFVDFDGNLYQKCSESEDDEKEYAWMICDSDGSPQGTQATFYADEKIERILPKIKRISF